MKNKIIIDTNIYYSLLSFFENSKVKENDLQNYKKYITSVTLYESIIKNRNKLENIKKITESFINKDFELISIGYIPFNDSDIYELNNINNIEDISNLIDKLINFRVERESEFAQWFFFQVIIIFLGVISVVDNYSFTDKNRNDEFNNKVKLLIESYENIILNELKIALVNAYKNDDTDKVFKQFFYAKVKEIFLKFIKLYYNISNKLDEYDNDKIVKIFCQNNDFTFLNKDKYKESVNNHINLFKKEFESQFYAQKLNSYTKKFIDIKLKKIFYEKSKLFKNDIFDFLLTFTISEEYYLLSLDLKFMNIIKEVDESSYELSKQLGYV